MQSLRPLEDTKIVCQPIALFGQAFALSCALWQRVRCQTHLRRAIRIGAPPLKNPHHGISCQEEHITYAKLSRAALGGAVAIVMSNIVSNILFFQLGRPLLFENEAQSAKVVAVLFEMEPLPLMFTNGPLYMAIAALIGVIHGLVFYWIEPALPRGIVARGLAFGAILWALMALYFEFHTPFNMFGEPVALVAVELVFWIAVVAVQGLVLSIIYGRSRDELASPVE
ncbi:hypothetical protein [Salipiger mucosus]|nr:hypothetical protein [Salipiger mucosus]